MVEMCHTKEFTYYLQLGIGFEIILKDLIVKHKVVTAIMSRLNITKLCDKQIEVGLYDYCNARGVQVQHYGTIWWSDNKQVLYRYQDPRRCSDPLVKQVYEACE